MKTNVFLRLFLLLAVFMGGAGLSCVLAQDTYVKWKRVDIESNKNLSALQGKVIVIVDMNTASAMTNDQGDKKPSAVKMTFNLDNDRITGDVPDNVQWTVVSLAQGVGFAATNNYTGADSDQFLLFDKSKGLSVGTKDAEKNNYFFSSTVNDFGFIHTVAINDSVFDIGIKASLFSNSWELKLENQETGAPDDNIKDTKIAIFQKVDDAQKPTYINFEKDIYDFSVSDLDAEVTIEAKEADVVSSTIPVVMTHDNSSVTFTRFESADNRTWEMGFSSSGTSHLTARIEETAEYDKAVAAATVTVSANEDAAGGINNPLPVANAIELVTTGHTTYGGEEITYTEDAYYYIKGVVSKVNSGLLAMFGDLGFGDMFEGLDDLDFDFDTSSMGGSSAGTGSLGSLMPQSDGVTYFISDEGLKENHLKVVNGLAQDYGKLTGDDIAVGDHVTVYGPLVYTEDKTFSIGGSGNGTGQDEESEPKKSPKVDEKNRIEILDQTLIVEDMHVYKDKTKGLQDLYQVKEENVLNEDYYGHDNPARIPSACPATVQPKDTTIVKWEYTDQAKTDSLLTGMTVGSTKMTAKVKVIVTSDDPATPDTIDEKSYIMKRKFNMEVRSRDLEPAGKLTGKYVLADGSYEIKDGDKWLLVGNYIDNGSFSFGTTSTGNNGGDDNNEKNSAMGSGNSMFGGGKSGTAVTVETETQDGSDTERKVIKEVPDNTYEIVIEKDGDYWNLCVGQDKDGNNLYLYSSDKKKEDTSGGDEGGDESGFDISALIEMIMPSSGLKTGTKEAVGDSCKATITIDANGAATIKFNIPNNEDKSLKNLVRFNTEMDMDFSKFMNTEETEEGEGDGNGNAGAETDPEQETGSTFNFSMPSFNSYKEDDTKGSLPLVYYFEQANEYEFTIGTTGWATIVSDVDAFTTDDAVFYVVTDVVDHFAILSKVESIKGHHPYMVYKSNGGTITMQKTDSEVAEPEVNMLHVSDATTNDGVYVLSKKPQGVGFYKWVGGELGSGRVYLSVPATNSARGSEFIPFMEKDVIDTGLSSVSTVTEGKTDVYYNISGQRVKSPVKKGVYIVNGKKVIK